MNELELSELIEALWAITKGAAKKPNQALAVEFLTAVQDSDIDLDTLDIYADQLLETARNILVDGDLEDDEEDE